jgi:hypothetical protein
MPLPAWNNRIVRHAEVPPRQLIAHDRNFRLHPSHQKLALRGAIRKLGFLRSVTVSERTGTILDGHLRVSLAIEDEQATVPVEYVDLTEAEEREALATFDPLGDMASIDGDNLDELLMDIDPMLVDQGLSSLLESLEAVGAAELPPVPVERPAPSKVEGEPLGKPITFTAGQREGVDEALQRFRELHGRDGAPLADGQIIVLILADWMSGV